MAQIDFNYIFENKLKTINFHINNCNYKIYNLWYSISINYTIKKNNKEIIVFL